MNDQELIKAQAETIKTQRELIEYLKAEVACMRAAKLVPSPPFGFPPYPPMPQPFSPWNPLSSPYIVTSDSPSGIVIGSTPPLDQFKGPEFCISTWQGPSHETTVINGGTKTVDEGYIPFP